jgi:beta-N-acetylhexosaminidase
LVAVTVRRSSWFVFLMAAVLIGGRQPAHAGLQRVRPAAQCLVSGSTIQTEVGQILMVGLDGTQLSASMAALLRQWQPGGVVIFDRNVATASQLRSLIAAVQRTASVPLLVATDQEGGTVSRIKTGLAPMPAEASYGTRGAVGQLYSDARQQGFALRALGFNLNLAPVVDVLSTPHSAIGSRSYGSDPELDAELVVAAILGYQSAGIAATAKHFLGLGSVQVNADLSLPVVKASRAVLEARDLVPMRAAVRAGVMALMMTRVQIPAFDPSGATAYVSAPMINGIVRGELGFTGMLITDSLLTDAIINGPGTAVAAVAALEAGEDMLLFGTGGDGIHQQLVQQAITALITAVETGRIPRSRLDDAVSHVLALKAQLGLVPAC